MGHSGALSLQGWLQGHGIDGVVMRDGDVREQTPIQSGTSKGGLLGKLGAHHHLHSVLGCGGKTVGEKDREKKGTVQYSSKISPFHAFVILVFST